MSQIIENWSDLTAKVLSVSLHPSLPGMAVVRLAVDTAAPVAGFAHLLGDSQGSELDVNVRREQIEKAVLATGMRVALRARKARPTVVFAHPDRFGAA
jgi:hypothetical protein